MRCFVRVTRLRMPLICALALLATSLVHVWGQQAAAGKRALTHQDYDLWRSIQAPQISRDGKFVAYAYLAQDGDSEIVVRNVASGTEWRAPRGYRPPTPPPDDAAVNSGEITAAQRNLIRPVLTADSRFAVFMIEPTKDEANRAKKEKKKPEDMPKNALGIMDLSSGQVTRIEKVKNFQVPEDGSGFVAYQLERKPDEKKPEASSTGSSTSTPAKEASASDKPSAKDPKKKEYGSVLVVRNTTSGAERTFNDVLDYTLSKDAGILAYTVSSKDEETNGVFQVTLQSDTPPAPLLTGKGKYQKLTWDEKQTELAFISDRDAAAEKQPKFKVYLWNRAGGAGSAVEIVSASSPGFRPDFVISEKATLSFSLEGSRLFLGTAPPTEPEKNPDEEIPADEKVLVDLWHWKDDYVQPIQKVRAEQDRNRSYRAIYWTQDRKFVQLGSEAM
jgi:hypothetical protein